MSSTSDNNPPKGKPQPTASFKGDAHPLKHIVPELKNEVPPKGKPQQTPPFKKNF